MPILQMIITYISPTYPISDKEYDTSLEVLESEISLTDCDAGIIYENFNGTFKTIAFINKKDNSNKKSY